jgi:hypothetical protein
VIELTRPVAADALHVPRDVNDIADVSRRGLAACCWSGEEIEWLVIRLMTTRQILGSWEARGATTVSGSRISRLEPREDAAPRNEYREKFLLAPIPGGESSEVNRNA